jgi:hypothetical protein
MRFQDTKLRALLSLSILLVTGGCAYLRPPDHFESEYYEPQPMRTAETQHDSSFTDSLLDSIWESWDYNREVRELEKHGYSEKEARQRAYEREYFRNNP